MDDDNKKTQFTTIEKQKIRDLVNEVLEERSKLFEIGTVKKVKHRSQKYIYLKKAAPFEAGDKVKIVKVE